jgi:hypothetical protein
MRRGRPVWRRRAPDVRAPRRGLFRKYALVCAALVTTALLASGLLQAWFTYQQLSDSQARLEGEEAATAAATIEQFFAQIEPQLLLVNQTVAAAGDARDG